MSLALRSSPTMGHPSTTMVHESLSKISESRRRAKGSRPLTGPAAALHTCDASASAAACFCASCIARSLVFDITKVDLARVLAIRVAVGSSHVVGACYGDACCCAQVVGVVLMKDKLYIEQWSRSGFRCESPLVTTRTQRPLDNAACQQDELSTMHSLQVYDRRRSCHLRA